MKKIPITPNPELINRLAKSVYPSFVFLTSMQLNIFAVLEDSAKTPKEVAEVLKVKQKHVERLLYALSSIGLLKIEKNKFTNSIEASCYLVPGKPTYMGNNTWINPILNYYLWGSAVKTAETIRTGTPQEKFDYTAVSEEQLEDIFLSLRPVAYKAGEELAKKYDLSQYQSFVDVGGASGALAIAVSERYPHLKITVADLPSVSPIAKHFIEIEGATDKVHVMTVNIVKNPLPETYDIAVLRALIQVLSPEDARRAIVNLATSINSKGRIFILGHFMDNSKTSPIEEVIWFLNNLNYDDEAGFYTEDNHINWLKEAGFVDIKREILPNGDGVIHAIKP